MNKTKLLIFAFFCYYVYISPFPISLFMHFLYYFFFAGISFVFILEILFVFLCNVSIFFDFFLHSLTLLTNRRTMDITLMKEG